MIHGRDLVVFSDDWGRHPSSCQHLFRRLAVGNRVLWVNTIGTRTPTLRPSDVRRAAGKIREWLRPPSPEATEVELRVDVIRPVMSPFDGFAPLRRWNAGRLRSAVGKAMAVRGWERPLLVTTLPNSAGVVGALGESASVYYCVDEFSEWPGADRKTLIEMEADLLQRVDLVVAASETLFEAKSAVHSRVRLLAHGVDWERFHSGEGRCPAELAALPHPRIGYAGLVDERLDSALVAEIARALPDAVVVLIGPRQLPAGELDRLANVRFLPGVPYDDMPAVVGALDVAFLPYLENALTERMNPLKLRELLASGVPVVATPLPAVRSFSAHVRLARGGGEWIEELRASIREGRTLAHERSESVREEGWEARAEQFSRYLAEAEALGG